MTTFAKSAAPPYALRTWADTTHVFLEIPAKDPAKLPPYVMKFSRTEGGLTKALAFMTVRHKDFAGPHIFTPPTLPAAVRVGSDLQQAHAQAVLRRLGVFK